MSCSSGRCCLELSVCVAASIAARRCRRVPRGLPRPQRRRRRPQRRLCLPRRLARSLRRFRFACCITRQKWRRWWWRGFVYVEASFSGSRIGPQLYAQIVRAQHDLLSSRLCSPMGADADAIVLTRAGVAAGGERLQRPTSSRAPRRLTEAAAAVVAAGAAPWKSPDRSACSLPPSLCAIPQQSVTMRCVRHRLRLTAPAAAAVAAAAALHSSLGQRHPAEATKTTMTTSSSPLRCDT